MPPASPQLHICKCSPLTTASYMYMPSSLSFSLCTVQAPSPQLPMYMPFSLSFSLCTCPPLTTASYVHNLLFFLFSLYMPPPHYSFICTKPPVFPFLSVHAPLTTASYVHNLLSFLFSLYPPPPTFPHKIYLLIILQCFNLYCTYFKVTLTKPDQDLKVKCFKKIWFENLNSLFFDYHFFEKIHILPTVDVILSNLLFVVVMSNSHQYPFNLCLIMDNNNL